MSTVGSQALSDAPITPWQGRPTLLPFPGLSCSENLQDELTEVTEQQKCRVPALQLTRCTSWGRVCVKAHSGEGFSFQLQPLPTGLVPIQQSHSILVSCQPQMPEACPHFLSPLHEEFCGLSFTTTQKSCISCSLGAVRPDPDQGLQMLLQ